MTLYTTDFLRQPFSIVTRLALPEGKSCPISAAAHSFAIDQLSIFYRSCHPVLASGFNHRTNDAAAGSPHTSTRLPYHIACKPSLLKEQAASCALLVVL